VSDSNSSSPAPPNHHYAQPVPSAVTEGVIDVLKVIEVQEQGGAGGLIAAVPNDHLRDAVHHQSPVGRPGERVVQGLMVQLPGPLLQLASGAFAARTQDEHQQTMSRPSATPAINTISALPAASPPWSTTLKVCTVQPLSRSAVTDRAPAAGWPLLNLTSCAPTW
jgi:hypothetical protein